MLSLARPPSKDYTERGTQTDFSADYSSSPSSPNLETKTQAENEYSTESSPHAPTHSRSSTQLDSAYSQSQADISFDSVSSEANRSMTTTTRAYKRVQLPTNRPSTLLERHSSSRVFSLPEATPKFHMKKVLGKTARVVSMPSAPPRDGSDGLEISTHDGDPFGSEDEVHTRVRVRSQATDVPYSPSAPSSPDSVEIIANNSNQLSNEFLRPRRDDLSTPESDDDDWLAWAESPPRPIPALHGPLSLPYARCPSGAEGTIIEEPESLPRVIWGLDADDSKGNRLLHSAVPSHSANFGKRDVQSADTHDRQKAKRDTKQSIAPTQTTSNRPTSRPPPPPKPEVPRPAQQFPQPPEFILKHSEPIDLARLVANSPDVTHHASPTDHSLQYSRWQASVQHQLPTPELVPDFSPELQAMLFAQERLRSQGISPSILGTPFGMGLLKSSASTGSAPSLFDSLKSSRSPIVLDDLATPYGVHAQALSSQMSGLALAQKYRQQQVLHGLLPTPPSSASPIWASSFSPYQGGILSPELLAAAGLTQLSPNYMPSHTFLPRPGASQHAQNPTLGTLDNLTTRKVATEDLASPAQINNGNTRRLPPRLAAEYAHRHAGREASLDVSQLENRPGQHLSSPVRGISQSPMAPKPPPNTPYGSASPYSTKRLDSLARNAVLATPSSPSSPLDSQSLSLSQHARSIPLSKLMQRRLSIVPEEDYTSSGENGRTPPVRACADARAAGNSSGLHLYLSPSSRPNINPASLGSLGNTAGTQHGMYDVSTAAGKRRDITASVRLPSVPGGKMPGPGWRGEAQAVKEVHRRQGSASVNRDGGQRADGGRGRGQKRGGRGRRGRGGLSHGAERVDGGMMVKS